MDRLLVKLGLKCSCGGWRTLFKKYKIHAADVKLTDGSWEAVHLKFRPCKSCGLAVLRPTTVKLERGGYYEAPPGSEVRVRIEQ